MTPERWKDIVGNIKDKFSVEETGHEHLEDQGGVDVEFIIFQGPLGRMRLEYVVKPVVLDKKTTYSQRIGSETKVTYIYSETEKNYLMNVYKWDEASENWEEIEAKGFNM